MALFRNKNNQKTQKIIKKQKIPLCLYVSLRLLLRKIHLPLGKGGQIIILSATPKNK